MKIKQLPNLLKLIITGIFFVTISINSNATIVTSATTGTWATASTWGGGVVPATTDTVVISSGDNVTVAANATIKKLTVEAGGYLTISSGKTLSVVGSDITINGLVNGAGALTFNTLNGILSGTGSVENTGSFNISKSISTTSSTNIIRSGSISILAAAIFTNNGTLIVSGNLNGATGATTAQFINATDAYLSIGNTLMTVGVLDASASGNTIDYASTAGRTVIATTYYNLTISGTGTKTIGAGTTTVLGDLTCSGILGGSSNTLDIKGDYTNTNTFSYSTSTVILSGSTNQTISLSATTSQSFYNLIVNKTSGSVSITNNSIVRNSLTLTSGNIINTGYKLTLGSATTSAATRGVLNYTSGTIVGGSFERYLHNTQSLATDFLFPVGTSSNYRPATINYTSITTSGKLALSFTESPTSNTGLPVTNGGVTSYNNFNDGQWVATGTSLVSTNYNLTLDANGFSSFALDANSRILTSATGTWAATGTHGSVTGSVLTRTGISGVTSSFAIASNNNCTLPTLQTIAGTALPCKNTTVTYSIPSNIGSTYAWTLPAGATISGSTNTNSINVVFDATTGSKTISVKETNSCGNGPTSTLTLNVGPVQPTKINGVSKVAEGDAGIVYYVDSLSGYTYTWSISGGTIASGQSKGRITANFATQGTSTLSVIATGCSSFASSTSKTITVAKTLVSTSGTGEIQDTAMWNGALITSTANILIDSGAVISVPASPTTLTGVTSLNISPSSTFTLNRNFAVSGNLVIDGTLNLNGFTLTVSGSDKLIRGNGSIIGAGTLSITGGSKTITADANLTIAGTVNIGTNSLVVTNNGAITIQTDLTGTGGGRSWVNGANSSLSVTGNVSVTSLNNGANSVLTVGGNVTSSPFVTGTGSTTNVTGTISTITLGTDAVLNATGTVTTFVAGTNSIANYLSSTAPTNLTATATGNTFNYKGVSPAIKATTYYNLNIDGSGVATLGATTIKGNFNALSGFTHGTATLTVSGSVEQSISSSDSAFYNLTITKPDTTQDVVFGTNLKVKNTVTMTLGNVNLNGKVLTLSSSTLSTGISGEKDNSRFIGNGYITATRNVPTGRTITGAGTGTGQFAGLGLVFATGTSDLGSVTVNRYTKSQGSGTNQTPSRYFDITPTNNSGLNVTLQTKYLEVEKSTTNIQPIKLWKSTDGGSNYSLPTGTFTFDSTNNIVTLAGISSFSRWAPGGPTAPVNPLPVELSKFSASREQNVIVVDWITVMEKDNKEFIVEKSVDGYNFEAIGHVSGNGNTNNVTRYNHSIINAPESEVFLRLKQVDFDGKYSYSKIIAVKAFETEDEGMEAIPSFSIFPNPVSENEVYLKFDNADKDIAVVQIYDASEKLYYTEEIEVEGNGVTKLFLVPSQTLSKGIYFVTIRTSTKTETLKLIVE